MQQVTNIKDLKMAVNQNGEMVVTVNNNEVVIMNMEEYKNKIFDEETEKVLLKSEEDIEKGRTKKGTEVLKELKEKYGF